MTKLNALTTAFLAFFTCAGTKSRPNENHQKAMTSIYEIKLENIKGQTETLAQYKGKKILIVNVASHCGYTNQYSNLQTLWEKHKESLVVLGFPANDFLGQEPGSNEEIASFCAERYHVTFPLFSKSHVIGAEKAPLYQWLSDKGKNGWNTQEPTWNFCKYLISEEGELLKFFNAKADPLGQEMLKAIEG